MLSAVTLDPRAMQIHTDGSAYRNPGHISGCAAFARYPEHLNRKLCLAVALATKAKERSQGNDLFPKSAKVSGDY